jgi:hypothetical protein
MVVECNFALNACFIQRVSEQTAKTNDHFYPPNYKLKFCRKEAMVVYISKLGSKRFQTQNR